MDKSVQGNDASTQKRKTSSKKHIMDNEVSEVTKNEIRNECFCRNGREFLAIFVGQGTSASGNPSEYFVAVQCNVKRVGLCTFERTF